MLVLDFLYSHPKGFQTARTIKCSAWPASTEDLGIAGLTSFDQSQPSHVCWSLIGVSDTQADVEEVLPSHVGQRLEALARQLVIVEQDLLNALPNSQTKEEKALVLDRVSVWLGGRYKDWAFGELAIAKSIVSGLQLCLFYCCLTNKAKTQGKMREMGKLHLDQKPHSLSFYFASPFIKYCLLSSRVDRLGILALERFKRPLHPILFRSILLMRYEGPAVTGASTPRVAALWGPPRRADSCLRA